MGIRHRGSGVGNRDTVVVPHTVVFFAKYFAAVCAFDIKIVEDIASRVFAVGSGEVHSVLVFIYGWCFSYSICKDDFDFRNQFHFDFFVPSRVTYLKPEGSNADMMLTFPVSLTTNVSGTKRTRLLCGTDSIREANVSATVH